MLIRKGAEANLYLETWYSFQVIKKIRIPKNYRLTQLDYKIRRTRTVREAQMLHYAKSAAITTPKIYFVDPINTFIIMEYIEGLRVKEILHYLSNKKREWVCKNIGKLIGRLHSKKIIHGDLTTSNIIIAKNNKIVFIDFGLSEYSDKVEKKGIDIHLMKRALQSTHYIYAKKCFNFIMEGYESEVGSETSKEIRKRVVAIAKRGRYSV